MYAGRSWSKKGPGEMSLPQREGRRPNQPPQKPSHPGQRARLALYTDVLSGLSQPLVDLTLFLDSDYDDVGKPENRAHMFKKSRSLRNLSRSSKINAGEVLRMQREKETFEMIGCRKRCGRTPVIDKKGECCSFTTPHIVEYQMVNPFLRGVGKQGEISPGVASRRDRTNAQIGGFCPA